MLRFTTIRSSARASTRGASTRGRERTLGQSLVEFALVIPILLFLTLIALDFGRVYLGYINLENMARIAANFAANNPSAWDATPDAAAQTKYRNQILADAAAINCVLPKNGAGTTIVPTPQFIDRNGNGRTNDLGDTAEVQIGCNFSVITPGIASVVGGSVKVAAASSFPVKAGMVVVAGISGPGSPPNAAFSGNGVITSIAAPATITGTKPFNVEFRDTSGGNPTRWTWTITPASTGVTTTFSTAQDPLNHTFDTPDTYTVTMKAENLYGSSTASMTVVVVDTSAVDFQADNTNVAPGTTVRFSDRSTSGGIAWAWTFGAGEGTSALQNPTHQYNTSGTYTVTLTVTYPSPTGPVLATKLGYIKVTVGMCLVPSLDGTNFDDALAKWQGAAPSNFTGVVLRATGAPSGNFKIRAQNRTAGSMVPCDTDVTVDQR